MTGLLGKKIGMTQIYTEDGRLISVTAIEAGPCPVLAINEKSVQLAFDTVKEKHVKRPQLGLFKKLKVTPRKIIREVVKDSTKEYKVGEEINVEVFKVGDKVDIAGTSIGKGFQGGMKRWHWHGGPRTHGSTSHRRIGSMGSATTPGRVFTGHHLPGHMGACRVTIQNLKVVKIDAANNLLLVEGAVPGNKNGYLMIRSAKKIRISKAAPAKAAAKAEKAKK
jgi:large subunit ribosomal protein L3